MSVNYLTTLSELRLGHVDLLENNSYKYSSIIPKFLKT